MELHNELEISAATSETGSLNVSLPLRDLPDELISFLLPQDMSLDPPRKKRKIGSVNHNVKNSANLESITISNGQWEFAFASSKVSALATIPLKYAVMLYVHWTSPTTPEYLEVLDEFRKSLIHLPLLEISEDFLNALLIDRDSNKWAKLHGRMFAEFDVSLIQRDVQDMMVLGFTIRWNTTASPYQLHQMPRLPPTLARLMSFYFPNPNIKESEKWSPQDFYQSAHAPAKDDDITALLSIAGLESKLYPFQKRSVKWLLSREGVELKSNGRIGDVLQEHNEALAYSFIEFEDATGKKCYVSHLFGLVTLDIAPFKAADQALKGGILAEEMGLGKTVEIISLINLHPRPHVSGLVYDIFTAQSLRATNATLIISPPSILKQWISEINVHSPGLKVMHYEGIKSKTHCDTDFNELLNSLACSDVVVTTYSVLAAEIHFTPLNPERTLRQTAKYPRAKSPLMLLSWWRCLIDEAQMIESGVSNAAVVAKMIPRINAWCVTGTPVRKDVKDLLGLLSFLRCEPYCSIKHVWASLLSSHKYAFQKLFGTIALRHSKKDVRDELKLPTQKRYVITMPFTPVEEQHYKELFQEMCADVGLTAEGTPLSDNWDPDMHTESMRRWLVRLRQTALHPEVGGRNKRALRHQDGPLRTIDQVLDAMIEGADVAIRTDHRALLVAMLKRGQLLENSPRVREALAIWEDVALEASVMVTDCRNQLKLEMARAKHSESSKVTAQHGSDQDSGSEDEIEGKDFASRLSAFRNRLRSALEVLHMAVFFKANAHFQIKTDEGMTVQDSPDFEALEKLETAGYEEAKRLRREILGEIFQKADKLMTKISKKAAKQTFVQIPEFKSEVPSGGIESRRIIEQVDQLAFALDAQANVLDEWREITVQLLLRSLIDEDDEVEITGDEYEQSTKVQDEIMVFVQALGAVIADRHDALTGQENVLIEHEVKTTLRQANIGEGPSPEKIIELLRIRKEIKPEKEMGSVRRFVAELRALSTSLRNQVEDGNARAEIELLVVQKQLDAIQKQLSEQSKATSLMEKELALFTNLLNTRVEFYRQMQQVSDTVVSYEGPTDEETMSKLLKNEEKLEHQLATTKSKRRYLDHLKAEAINASEQRMCVICQEEFSVGALTVCGHQYCSACIALWWKAHKSCPICKRKLLLQDLHEITYKPQELSVRSDSDVSKSYSSVPKESQDFYIYSEFSKDQLAAIKNIDLDGPSFTTKVDTLSRHIVWLRESDPGAKSIIFSHFKEFLLILEKAFERHRIGFSSMEKPDGIERFKSDASVECFLLHAKSQSAGLNLQGAASHVFLCEPLLNYAIQAQAVARVDRIGQHQETCVWLYLVDGTVEESIHELSVKRRMEHVDLTLNQRERGKGKGKQTAAAMGTALEEADSLELQQASLSSLVSKGSSGGEIVQKDDLWECLFGGVQKRNANQSLMDHEVGRDKEVRRYLRAEAAENRASKGVSDIYDDDH